MIFVALIFFNFKRTFDMTDFPYSIYRSKTVARHFDRIHILLYLSLVKDRNSQTWRERGPTHIRLSGTEGLI